MSSNRISPNVAAFVVLVPEHRRAWTQSARDVLDIALAVLELER